MSNFEIQWKALKDRKDEDDPDVPMITKALKKSTSGLKHSKIFSIG